MEQQMSSLYAAFGIMNDDQAEERRRNEITMRTLLESDAAIAKEADEKEAATRDGGGSGSAAKKPLVRGRPVKSGGFMPRQMSLRTGKSGKGRDGNSKSDRVTYVGKAAVRPAAPPPLAKGELFLLLDKKSREPLPAGSIPSKSTRKLSLRGKRGGSGTDPAAVGYTRQVSHYFGGHHRLLSAHHLHIPNDARSASCMARTASTRSGTGTSTTARCPACSNL